jgi:hypothetical protein
LLTQIILKTSRDLTISLFYELLKSKKPLAIPPCAASIPEIAVSLPAMAKVDDFNDRQNQIDAENEPYHQYEYQTEKNESWAGALPVKQYVICVPRAKLC